MNMELENTVKLDKSWLQELEPEFKKQYMKDLKIRKVVGDDEAYEKALSELRAQIDVIDHQLIEVMSSRMKISDTSRRQTLLPI